MRSGFFLTSRNQFSYVKPISKSTVASKKGVTFSVSIGLFTAFYSGTFNRQIYNIYISEAKPVEIPKPKPGTTIGDMLDDLRSKFEFIFIFILVEIAGETLVVHSSKNHCAVNFFLMSVKYQFLTLHRIDWLRSIKPISTSHI